MDDVVSTDETTVLNVDAVSGVLMNDDLSVTKLDHSSSGKTSSVTLADELPLCDWATCLRNSYVQ